MTMKMLINESRSIGNVEKLVSLIRNLELDIETATKAFHVDAEYISLVQDVIKQHPEMDDEEIAEIIVDL